MMVAGLLLMAGAMNVMAENVLSIGGYDILPGESKTLTVDMTNTDGIAFLQFYIDLPEGLETDGEGKTWFVRNEERIKGKSLEVLKRTDTRYEVLLFGFPLSPIAGNEGVVFSLKVKATADYDTKGKIRIASLKGGTDEAGSKDVVTVGETGLYTGEFSNLQVQPLIQLDAETIKQDAGKKYNLVSLEEGSESAANVAAKIAELNAKIEGQELTRNEAIEQLDGYMEYLEKLEGDVNLDGSFNSRDVQKLFNDLNNQEEGFDYTGDNKFNSRDVQSLFNKLNNR